MMQEHSRFQLEATKLARTVVFQVTVFSRGDAARPRLYAETQCSDPLHFLLQFVVRDAPDFQSLLQKFQGELAHRGFEPVRYRLREGSTWQDWLAVPALEPPPAQPTR
jgi:hypothetical protein